MRKSCAKAPTGLAWRFLKRELNCARRESRNRYFVSVVFGPVRQRCAFSNKLTPVVYRLDMIEALNQAAANAGTVVDVHVKVDTGMGRLGIRFDQLSEFVGALDAISQRAHRWIDESPCGR